MAKFNIDQAFGNPLDAALQAEGITGARADIARSIYHQESGSGANTTTSNAGARGGMQIIPATFNSVADKGWAIDDPVQNARAGVRYVSQLYDKAGGDPQLTAAGYYGGPGAIAKARNGIAVSDPRNPNAPNTLQYAQQVASRLPQQNQQQKPRFSIDDALNSSQQQQTPTPAPQSTGLDFGLNPDKVAALGQGLKNAAGGFVRSGMGLVSNLMRPIDALTGANDPTLSSLIDGNTGKSAHEQRMARVDSRFKQQGYDPNSASFQGAKVGGDVIATLPVGGALAKVPEALAAIPALAGQAPKLVAAANALRTGGFSTGLPAATTKVGMAGQLALRSGAGATVGGVSAGMIDPNSAGVGAGIGAMLPPVLTGTGKIMRAAGSALSGGGVTPEVQALATRAKELGINIPADRIGNSRPMNALASSLNYVPFSGRAATEGNMTNQLTRAASNLIGQDGDNMAIALRKASDDLGGKFDTTLKTNPVKLDDNLLQDIVKVDDTAQQQLGSSDYKAIYSQVAELLKKGESGQIDGQAAYNIKRTLDRMGRTNSPSAFHALELKQVLMDGLNRSLGPQKAAEFAQTRQQYGNMIALQKVALNGAEGDISVGRLAGMKNINNKPLQEIADIAAQFVKSREGNHGAMQRVGAGLGLGAMAGPAWLAGGAVAGRAGNMMLNSNVARNLVMNPVGGPGVNRLADRLWPALYRSAPALAADR